MILPSNDKGAAALAWQTASAPADPRANIIPRPRVRANYNSLVAPLRSKQPGNPVADKAQWQAVHCMADGFDFPGDNHVKCSSSYSSMI
jgi:ribosomal protein S30